jgi:hypothetical protein
MMSSWRNIDHRQGYEKDDFAQTYHQSYHERSSETSWHSEENYQKRASSSNRAPDLPLMDHNDDSSLPCFFAGKPGRQSVSTVRDDRPMMTIQDESFLRQQSQWEDGYPSDPGQTLTRQQYMRDAINQPPERAYDDWYDPYDEGPAEPLLDQTFSRTIQLIASGDNGDNQNAFSTVFQGGDQYPAAPSGPQPYQRFCGPTYNKEQCRDVAESPNRTLSPAMDGFGYTYEVTPTSVMAFPAPVVHNSLRPSSVDYGQLVLMVDALDEFTFALPNLTRRMRDRYSQVTGPSEEDLVVARRRLISAVCFYGGNRPKASEEALARMHPMALRNRRRYEFLLSRRYTLHDDNISWNIEENPPVGRPLKKAKPDAVISNGRAEAPEQASSDSTLSQQMLNSGSDVTDGKSSPKVNNDQSAKGSVKKGGEEVTSTLSGQERKKAPYHCRLCGQPKQKHDCPFLKDLQRNIGTMIYPVINAFKTDEVGKLAPRLLEMNNFVAGRYCAPIESESEKVKAEKETEEEPEQHEQQKDGPGKNKRSALDSSLQSSKKGKQDAKPSPKRPKLTIDCTEPESTVATVEILPQQYKAVTAVLKVSPVAYRYAYVPVVKSQRVKLSDDLFAISEQTPNLTKECAEILDEAQEMSMWDQAAAELFAQVLAIVHCPVGDHRLDGLSKHLHGLGVAC